MTEIVFIMSQEEDDERSQDYDGKKIDQHMLKGSI